jgi:hypothetical protein
MIRLTTLLLIVTGVEVHAEESAALWSLEPLSRQALPKVPDGNWANNPLDRFIYERLQKVGVEPGGEASKRNLIRRVTFDLTGLPPTQVETRNFLEDSSPEAYEKVIDRLLSSPRYGERWGRHWLDVARYADSNGLDENIAHGNAWRYRDWVVSSFNADKPFERFVLEQLAGDLLGQDASKNDRDSMLIATGFLSLGTKSLAESDLGKLEMDIIDEQLDTIGRTFMGLTLGCARCHDHKYDPISTADYYALAGIFKSTRTMESLKRIAKWNENALSQAPPTAHLEEVEKMAKEVARLEAALEAAQGGGEKDLIVQTKNTLEKTRKQLAELKAREVTAMGVREGKPVDLRIHHRGSHLDLGKLVSRGIPAALERAGRIRVAAGASGRLELARWLTGPEHPLTARVIANRVWRWHFGRGLVDTPDNFGIRGGTPEHRGLLDWLACRIRDSGWSIKDLNRLIVSSRTYRSSSRDVPLSAQRDPGNRLLWRWPVRRLEAEALRDAVLSVSGKLDLSLGGPALKHVKNREFLFDHTSKDKTSYDSPRRTLYLPVIRNHVYDALMLFDFPDPAVPNGNRATTTVASQGLFLMNSEITLAAGAALADRLLGNTNLENDAERSAALYSLILGRRPQDFESRRCLEFLQSAEVKARPPVLRWQALAHVLLLSNEFLHLR